MISLTWVPILLQGWHPLLCHSAMSGVSQHCARRYVLRCPQYGGPAPAPRMVWWTCYPRSAQAAPIRSSLLRETV